MLETPPHPPKSPTLARPAISRNVRDVIVLAFEFLLFLQYCCRAAYIYDTVKTAAPLPEARLSYSSAPIR